MFGRQALIIFVLTLGVSLGAQGAAEPARGRTKALKPAKMAVKKVRLKNGGIVVRLNMPAKAHPGTAGKGQGTSAYQEDHQPSPEDSERAKKSQLMDQWLDAVTEPRFMTALAAVATNPSIESKAIGQTIDPSRVRNWAEFVDPDLYLRWMAGSMDPRFNQAIHNRGPEMLGPPNWFAFPVRFAIPQEFRAGAPLKPTIWSNAFSDGAGGRESAQEWLKLPSQDPRSNPWLHAGQNYRY
jgi:hypothetical protein